MDKKIGFCIVVLFSLVMVINVNAYEKIETSDYSLELINNSDNCLSDCYAEIEICNKLSGDLKVKNEYDIWFVNDKGKDKQLKNTIKEPKDIEGYDCDILGIEAKKNIGENIDWKIEIFGVTPNWAWWNASVSYRRIVGVSSIMESINGTNPTDIDGNGLFEWLYCYNETNVSYIYYNDENDTWCGNDTHIFWLAQTEPIEQYRGTQDETLYFYLPFDSSTNDYSGRDMHSTFTQGDPIETSGGYINDGWDFDGDDGLLYPQETVLNTWEGTSILFRFQTEATEDYGNIFHKTDASNDFSNCRIEDDGKLGCHFDGDSAPYDDVVVESTASVEDNNIYCAVVRINSTHGELWLNGILNDTDQHSGLNFGTGNMSVGGRYDSSETWDRYFTGMIDDFMVYNKTITEVEINDYCFPNSVVLGEDMATTTTSTTTTIIQTLNITYHKYDCVNNQTLRYNLTECINNNCTSSFDYTYCSHGCLNQTLIKAFCSPDPFSKNILWLVVLIGILILLALLIYYIRKVLRI